MRTRKEMIEALIEDQLSTVEQLVASGDTQTLDSWLGPVLLKESGFDEMSEEELLAECQSQLCWNEET